MRKSNLVYGVYLFFMSAMVMAEDCGNLENAYGPFDYTNAQHRKEKLPVVEKRHFTASVEKLQGGQSGRVIEDLDYTLRAFPNHHRALYAVSRYYLINKDKITFGGNRSFYSARCYFDRALRFKFDDSTVHLLFGIYLHKDEELDAAEKQYKAALKLFPKSSETHYNIGLLYLDKKQYKLAKQHAEKAYKLGYPLMGLSNKLKALGKW